MDHSPRGQEYTKESKGENKFVEKTAEYEEQWQQFGDEWRDMLGERWYGMELEISEEATQWSPQTTPDFNTSSSTPTTEDSMTMALSNVLLTSVPHASSLEDKQPPLPDMAAARSSPAASNTIPANEWSCRYCGESFTHRHKLNRHQKYHFKPYKCIEISCSARSVAFSLEKDLVRHQARHNGRRFYCHHAGCGSAYGGPEGGFTRKDNLKRHIATQHR